MAVAEAFPTAALYSLPLFDPCAGGQDSLNKESGERTASLGASRVLAVNRLENVSVRVPNQYVNFDKPTLSREPQRTPMVAAKDKSHGEFDKSTDTYRRDGNWETESVSAAVAEAVSTVMSTPTTDLDPLYNVINPDALDLLFKPTYDGSPRLSGGTTTFTYNDCRVTVHADGEVVVNHVPQE